MSDTTETIEITEVSEEPVDGPKPSKCCLLYTSDAADEYQRVLLGGGGGWV